MSNERAGLRARLLAALVDVVLGGALALLLSGSSGHWFSERAVVMLGIGSPDTFWNGPVPYVIGIFGSVVYGAPLAFALVSLSDALFGATPGKWLLKLRVASADGSPPSRTRLFARWALKHVCAWGLVLALVLGESLVAGAAIVLGAVVLVGSVAAGGPRRLALHDMLSRTAVLSEPVARHGRP
ncbi:MAG: RDD family protein [Candidatus Eisenbacteria bacterium]